MRIRRCFPVFCLAVAASFLVACGTTSRVTSRLPKYEAPIAKTEFQHVRTTAYTHTESDHRQFSNRNALGGRLQPASGAIRRAEYTPRAGLATAGSYAGPGALQPFSLEGERTSKVIKTKRGRKRVTVVSKPRIGSAAADWSRWPAGTVFRLLSTGQVYNIDDYGWALAGRNTIDLYMPNRRAMNSWGAREETIQILRWGDPNVSLGLLQGHQGHRHIRRMVLQLEGKEEAAARLE